MKQTIKTLLVGAAMGTADLIPGVSGGTIAFITGIYEKLLASIAACDGKTVKLLFAGQLRQLWQRINGTFLVTLFLGILAAIFLMAQLMSQLLALYPHLVKGFFLGIIISSVLVLSLPYLHLLSKHRLFILAGAAVGLLLTISQFSLGTGRGSILLAGMLASVAMILPGISGSYILVIIEKYEFILTTVVTATEIMQQHGSFLLLFTERWTSPGWILILFLLGVVIGLLGFAKLLTYILKRRHDQTILLLLGLMIGALPSVWPRSAISTATQTDHLRIILWIIIGVLLVTLLRRLQSSIEQQNR